MGAAKTVKITCKGVAYDAIDNFVWFQGDLKVLPEANYEKLKRLILRLGFCVPLGIWLRDNELVLVDGHQRILTLKRMRDEGYVVPMVPYFPVEAADINDAKEKVLSMASQFGVVTDTGLLSFVADSNIKISKLDDHYVMPGLDLKAISQIDLPPPGEQVQVSAHTRTMGITEEDEGVQRLLVQTEDTVKPGEIWELGGHRLLCGDCTVPENIQKLMGKEQASVWASDPPYGINHVAVSNEKGQSKGYAPIANDELQDDELQKFIYNSIFNSLPYMKKGFALYMWHAMKMQAYFSQAAAAAGVLFHRQIIWVKPQFVFGRGHYHWRHELCLMGWLKGDEPPFYGPKNQSTVWEIGRENDKIHPTQKPVALWEPAILNHTVPGEIVYEPFAGSGSTLIACEKLERRCFAFELDPHYCSVIVARWEKLTGKTAKLEKVGG